MDYQRDPNAIYRESFAIIRAEADLTQIPADLEPLAVRVAHACGMPDIIGDLRFSPDAGEAGRTALEAGASILCDSRMVVWGITRARLPAENPIICALDDPRVPELARTLGNTRSAATLNCGVTISMALWWPSAMRRLRSFGCWKCSMLAARARRSSWAFRSASSARRSPRPSWPRTGAAYPSSWFADGVAAAPWPPPPSMPSAAIPMPAPERTPERQRGPLPRTLDARAV